MTAWWRRRSDIDPAARAVIDFAAIREHPTDAIFDGIADLLLPDCADVIRDIADALYWIERLETERAADVLSDLDGRPVTGMYLDVVADAIADDKRADVIRQASLVASLISAKRAAA